MQAPPKDLYMFNVGTDSLEDGFEPQPDTLVYELSKGDLNFLELSADSTTAQSMLEGARRRLVCNESPIPTTQQEFVLQTNVRNVPAAVSHRVEPTWRPRPISVKKFVDDNLTNENSSSRAPPPLRMTKKYTRTPEQDSQKIF